MLSLVHLAGKRAVMVVGKDKFRQLAAAGSTDSYTCATRGDDDVVNEAIVQSCRWASTCCSSTCPRST